jgi:acyl CoA:acetate/3-ketoacid CoA transferase beta subunit
LVDACTYPLTGRGIVNRIYTDLCVIDVTPAGFHLAELAPGVDLAYVTERTGAPLQTTP